MKPIPYDEIIAKANARKDALHCMTSCTTFRSCRPLSAR